MDTSTKPSTLEVHKNVNKAYHKRTISIMIFVWSQVILQTIADIEPAGTKVSLVRNVDPPKTSRPGSF